MPTTDTTHGDYWEGTVLPYWVFLVFTAFPLTGFFGIDHLLFKSPSTALKKCLFNIVSLGLWYIYDILQAFGDKHYVKHFGLSVPISGAKGLAFNYFSGIVSGEKDTLGSSKAGYMQVLYFMLYLGTILLPLGISNFVVGDNYGGLFKILFSLIPLLGLLLILVFWLESVYELYILMTNPTKIYEKGVPRMFPLTSFIDETGFSPNIMEPKALGKAIEARSKVEPTDMYTSFVKPILKIMGIKDPMEILDTAKCEVIPPIEKTAKAVLTAGKGVAKLAEKVPAIAAEAANKVAAFTDPEKLKEAALKTAQVGGGLTGMQGSDAIFLGGLALLVLGGVGASVLRKTLITEENVSTDAPPNPGAI